MNMMQVLLFVNMCKLCWLGRLGFSPVKWLAGEIVYKTTYNASNGMVIRTIHVTVCLSVI